MSARAIRRLIGATCCVAMIVVTAALAAGDGGLFEIRWSSLDGGGAVSGGRGYTLTGTIGQSDAGVLNGGDLVLTGGFIPGGSPPPGCPTDANGDSTVNVDDLVAVILQWGACANPPETCTGDVDDNAFVDVDDLVQVLLSWGACP